MRLRRMRSLWHCDSANKALYKFTERQVGFKFNQPTKALAAHGHISPINMLSDDTATIFGLGVLRQTQEFRTPKKMPVVI